MNKLNSKIKSTGFVIVFMLLIGVMGVGGLSAYFMDADTADNRMTIGGNRIELIEEFVPPKELIPGTQFTKDVKVENVGPNDCFVRIKAVFTDSDMEKYCEVDFDTNNYEYNISDGFYYYKKILKSGETTPSLFSTVSLSSETPADEIKDFDILVYTESYQSEGFTDYHDAWEHYARNNPSKDEGGN